jgi:AcrR family transcriptional regulator
VVTPDIGPAHLRSDAVANRRKLVEAARAVFAEQGLDAEMKEIAERAGVGVGTIYRNFATKEDLVVALVQDLIARVEAMMAEAANAASPMEAIIAAVRLAFHCASDNSGLIQALRAVSLPPALEHIKRDTRIEGPVLAIFQRGIDAGIVRGELSATFLASYFSALFPLYLALSERIGAEAAADGAIDLFLRGILVDPSLTEAATRKGSLEIRATNQEPGSTACRI